MLCFKNALDFDDFIKMNMTLQKPPRLILRGSVRVKENHYLKTCDTVPKQYTLDYNFKRGKYSIKWGST